MVKRRSLSIKTKKTPTNPEVAEMVEKIDNTQTSLELLYGKQGVPEEDAFIRVSPKKEESPKLLPDNSDRLRVTIHRDHVVDYPELYLSIFVAGDKAEEARFAKMFSRAKCSRAKSLEEADLIVFTGGVDVDPVLYGESKHWSTYFFRGRDDSDIRLYAYALERGIPMFGVCRGAQFLSVMQGGKLYQDISGHNGDHPIFDTIKKVKIEKVSSVHHQAVIFHEGMHILATANRSKGPKFLNEKESVEDGKPDIEAFFYRDPCCLGVQGHPEYSGYPYFTKWCLQLIRDHIIENPDVGLKNGFYRIKEDILAFRSRGVLSEAATSYIAATKEKK